MNLVAIALPVFLLIGIGFAMRKLGVLSAVADESIVGIVVKLLAPCLAFDVIVGNEAFATARSILLPPVAGFATIVVGVSASYVAARIFRLSRGVVTRTFAHSAGIQNYGYIALPICAALFGRDAVGVLFAYNLGVEIAFWTISLMVLRGRSSAMNWRQMINPPILAIVGSLIFNAVGGNAWVPAPVHTAIHMLGTCAMPLGILMTGAVLADFAQGATFLAGWNCTAAGLFLRLGAMPLLMLGFAKMLTLDPLLECVLVVQAAMPAGVFSMVTSKLFGGDMPTALRVVIGTSLVSLVTTPLWLAFGIQWVLK